MKQALGALTIVACCIHLSACHGSRDSKDSPAAQDSADSKSGASDAGSGSQSAFDGSALAIAEDTRRASAVGVDSVMSPDARVRRRAAMALARIADTQNREGVQSLTSLLSDDDEETAAWAAYGLAFTCKGREDVVVRALAARAAPLAFNAKDPTKEAPKPDLAKVDLHRAIARGVGRCGGALAESTLAAWVRAKDTSLSDAALVGLGDLASRKKDLSDEAMIALVAAASGDNGDSPPRDMALYGIGRVQVKDAFSQGIVTAARAALTRKGDARIFAVKALARCGKEAVPDLARVAGDKTFSTAERAEAARALGTMNEAGKTAAIDLVAKMAPDKDPFAITALGGDEFSVLLSLVQSIGQEPPKSAEPALYAIAGLVPPGDPPPMLARRLGELRCTAALALARGAWDADVLVKCDKDGTYAKEKAQLAAITKRPISPQRREAFVAFTKSTHLRIREEAVEMLGNHPELGDTARQILLAALKDEKPGMVTTAADLITAHPDRVLTLARSEIRAALDPRAPPPSQNPAEEVDDAVAHALASALEKKWRDDLIETRTSLLDAAVALKIPAAKKAADAACKDQNVTMREHGAKALRTLGDATATCPLPSDLPPPAAETLAPHVGAKLVFATDAGELTISLEPDLAPVTVARLEALAKAGFYKGIVVHRVVPAFVVQFGDPDGDGYGGSGALLRCETSPTPFMPHDVGMALAGRDTGSSQLFVTLARTPHLDGEYTRVGHADGDWDGVAEGDVISDVTVK